MPAVELAGEVDEMSLSSLNSALEGKMAIPAAILAQCRPHREGQAVGLLVPVTLSVLCSLLGTEYFPDLKGAILIIEDVNEVISNKGVGYSIFCAYF